MMQRFLNSVSVTFILIQFSVHEIDAWPPVVWLTKFVVVFRFCLFEPDLLALVDLDHLAVLDNKANGPVADFFQGDPDALFKLLAPLLGVCGQISLSHYSPLT